MKISRSQKCDERRKAQKTEIKMSSALFVLPCNVKNISLEHYYKTPP
jgi:hypothetical protein